MLLLHTFPNITTATPIFHQVGDDRVIAEWHGKRSDPVVVARDFFVEANDYWPLRILAYSAWSETYLCVREDASWLGRTATILRVYAPVWWENFNARLLRTCIIWGLCEPKREGKLLTRKTVRWFYSKIIKKALRRA